MSGFIQTRATFENAIKHISIELSKIYSEVDRLLQNTFPRNLVRIEQEPDGGVQTIERNWAGTPYWEEVAEGDVIPQVTQTPGYSTNYVFRKFGQGTTTTLEALEDQTKEFRQFLDSVKQMTIAGVQTQIRAAFQIFNGGFTTTPTVNGITLNRMNDGVPLFSTMHPRYDGGTSQSNVLSNSAPLDKKALEDLISRVLDISLDDGKVGFVTGKPVLVVPTPLWARATEFADSELSPVSGNNSINPFKFYEGGEMDYMVSNFLSARNGGSDTAWFVLFPDVSQLKLKIRTEIKVLPTWIDPNTANVLVSCVQRIAPGYNSWYGTGASKGDNSTYTG